MYKIEDGGESVVRSDVAIERAERSMYQERGGSGLFLRVVVVVVSWILFSTFRERRQKEKKETFFFNSFVAG